MAYRGVCTHIAVFCLRRPLSDPQFRFLRGRVSLHSVRFLETDWCSGRRMPCPFERALPRGYRGVRNCR